MMSTAPLDFQGAVTVMDAVIETRVPPNYQCVANEYGILYINISSRPAMGSIHFQREFASAQPRLFEFVFSCEA